MRSDEVTLRAYREGDALAMFLLDRRCFDQRFRFSLHAMRDFAEAEGAVSVVAEVDGAMAGFAIAEVEESTAYLVTLDVEPSFRRMGIARAMLRWIEERSGVRAVELHVYVENEAAIRFYESAGFLLMERVMGFYGEGLDGFAYRRSRVSMIDR